MKRETKREMAERQPRGKRQKADRRAAENDKRITGREQEEQQEENRKNNRKTTGRTTRREQEDNGKITRR